MPPGGTRFAVARRLGSAAAALSRLTGSGGGTTIGGRVMLAVDPFALRRAAAGRRLILVSGTNGKSTTRTLLTAALRTRGAVVSNEGGANMPAGLTAALAADPNAEVGVLEVDEPYLPAVITATRPAAVVLLNISRDQLDRYAEVRRLAGGWREALGRPSAPHVIANADDPLIAWAAGTARSVTWVSVGLRWRSDATVCPACGGLIHFGPADWRCDCGWRRPQPQWRLEEDVLLDPADRRHHLVLQLPGAVNRGNAAMAAVAAATLGVSVPSALHLRCPKCDEVVLRVSHSRRLQEDAIAIYRRKHGLLSADEIRAIRERFGLTQSELAHLLHLGANTISRWESGRNVQTEAMEMLLRLVRDLPGSLDYLRRYAA